MGIKTSFLKKYDEFFDIDYKDVKRLKTNYYGNYPSSSSSLEQKYCLANEESRVDLRDIVCFPYPPVENQGDDVSCVAHSFAMAFFCVVKRDDRLIYPNTEEIFKVALDVSPNKKKGVSFPAIAKGLRERYQDLLQEASFASLPNDAFVVRNVIRKGYPIIAGYQVDRRIDKFHKNASVCEKSGYLLPPLQDLSSKSAHAVLIVGYDCSVNAFIARNSWGTKWGVDGHFLIPFYVLENEDHFTDLWTLMRFFKK